LKELGPKNPELDLWPIQPYERNDHNELWSMVIDFIEYAEMATSTPALRADKPEGGLMKIQLEYNNTLNLTSPGAWTR
jgi:hypothetical protein